MFESNPSDKSIKNSSTRAGHRLGAGQFGMVVKGEAKGICRSEPNNTVAVKKAKVRDQLGLKALQSELKLTIYIGRHLNVVNVLGSCTTAVAEGWHFHQHSLTA